MTRLRGNHSRSSSEPAGRIRAFCTGRGGHAPVMTDPAPGEPGRRCPVCGIIRRIGYRARKRIAEAGLTEVDISALPF